MSIRIYGCFHKFNWKRSIMSLITYGIDHARFQIGNLDKFSTKISNALEFSQVATPFTYYKLGAVNFSLFPNEGTFYHPLFSWSNLKELSISIIKLNASESKTAMFFWKDLYNVKWVNKFTQWHPQEEAGNIHINP